ncbi:MAG TPA: methylmalonyl-CoA epimerase [Streptosporangiaceae bacterium]|jgi:methylmalonyl-CoA/ethylmalonyl-CoA epimerase
MSATIPTYPLLTRIDHVGIACRNLDEAVEKYQRLFCLTVVSTEVNEAQGVREAMLGAGPGYVQLLEPLGAETPVGKFLARRGEGIHHIGYGVEDIHSTLDLLKLTEVRLLDERPRHGSMGASIAFLHPADLGGVLTELVQAPAGAKGIYGDA